MPVDNMAAEAAICGQSPLQVHRFSHFQRTQITAAQGFSHDIRQ